MCAAVEAGAKVVVPERAAVRGASVMSLAACNVVGPPWQRAQRSRTMSGRPWPTGLASVDPPDRAAIVDELKQGLATMRENGLVDAFAFRAAEPAETLGVEQ